MARERGFTYVWVLLAVALTSAALASVAEQASLSAERQRTVHALWVREQYRSAIDSYAAVGEGTGRRGPERLEQLLRDERGGVVRRHLRMMYPDPVTGRSDWILVRGEDGSIVVVKSRIDQASESGARH
jgi:type II secretory pathway pseudopilin PulG